MKKNRLHVVMRIPMLVIACVLFSINLKTFVRTGGLIPGGVILFEIGYDQGRAVSELLEDKGYRDIQVIKDLAGLDRVVKAHRPLM